MPLESATPRCTRLGTPQNSPFNFTGTVYVATPQLLATYGIKASQIAPGTDILTMRPGLAGLPHMEMIWSTPGYQSPGEGARGGSGSPPCTLSNDCLASPVMQTVSGLPGGTSAPNTVITQYAVSKYHLQLSLNGWLVQAPAPLTAAQIKAGRQLALAYGATAETKSSAPGLGEFAAGGTALGIVIAFGVLASSVGLIRSETARDLRTLTATGASRSDPADDHRGDRRRAGPARRDPRRGQRGDRRAGLGAQQPDRHVRRPAADRRADPAGRAAAGCRGGRLAAGQPRAGSNRQAAAGLTRVSSAGAESGGPPPMLSRSVKPAGDVLSSGRRAGLYLLVPSDERLCRVSGQASPR